MDGPDQIIDTEDVTTWKPNGYYKIKGCRGFGGFGGFRGLEKSDSINPTSLVTAIKNVCESPDASELTAFKVKRNGEWKSWSYAEYYRDIKCVARAFIQLGLEPRHAVAICGFNSPEWFLSEMACIYTGGMVRSIVIRCFGVK